MILALVVPSTAGDPMSDQRWLNCRLVDIQQQLAPHGISVSKPVISRILRHHGYTLRANVKQAAGKQHPDRDCQFQYIARQRQQAGATAQPIISVDTKKKELIGNFKHAGRIWCPEAEVVNQHDFRHDAVGVAVPYGIYDIQHTCGTVYVGQSADTPAFAVGTSAHWCATELRERYPDAHHLWIVADSGGSNGARSRAWNYHLHVQVADTLGLTVTVCQYPPGTSTWNPIEHRLFSEISKTWAGCPLRSFAQMRDYLKATTTQTGLRVRAHLVTTTYRTGEKSTNAAMAALTIQFHDVCPQWNYTIHPRSPDTLEH
jgi:hypothetical protein